MVPAPSMPTLGSLRPQEAVGSDSFPSPATPGPGCLGGVRPTQLSATELWEVVRKPVALVTIRLCPCCDLAGVSQPDLACEYVQCVPTQLSPPVAGFSLSVKSQLSCYLLRGASPDLPMQSGPLFHFLSRYCFICSYVHHAVK